MGALLSKRVALAAAAQRHLAKKMPWSYGKASVQHLRRRPLQQHARRPSRHNTVRQPDRQTWCGLAVGPLGLALFHRPSRSLQSSTESRALVEYNLRRTVAPSFYCGGRTILIRQRVPSVISVGAGCKTAWAPDRESAGNRREWPLIGLLRNAGMNRLPGHTSAALGLWPLFPLH